MAVRGALECEDQTQYLECWGEECSLDLRAVGSRKHLGMGKRWASWASGSKERCGSVEYPVSFPVSKFIPAFISLAGAGLLYL